MSYPDRLIAVVKGVEVSGGPLDRGSGRLLPCGDRAGMDWHVIPEDSGREGRCCALSKLALAK